MASLKLEHIYKVYPNGHKAVSDFNMQIKDGEFIVFVGPSGCGKSTTLRMIAGLEDISSGELYIGDTLVNDMQPKDRDIAMVFQNYALYPHMTVYENMAFGLTLRKTPRAEIHEKVMWAAEVLGLKDYLDRKPKAMSGGQRQRVSLGRAILRNPKVMLLDEPLSNLDAKLRSQMRSEISKLHQKLKTTFIYVTHDQVEAMTLGTRVVVMKLGRVQQIDSPQNLYDHPVNKFVAGFIGTPQMNFFNVTLLEEKDKVRVHFVDAEQPDIFLTKEQVLKAERKYLTGEKVVTLGFRCENVAAVDEDGEGTINVIVSHFEELGDETLIYGDLKEVGGLGGETQTSIIIKAPSKLGHVPGDIIKAKIDTTKIHLFDNDTEMTILPAIPEDNVLPVKVENEKLTLFGTINKPDSIAVDLLQEGTITLPLTAFRVGEGNVKAKILKLEHKDDVHLALVEANKLKLFVFVDENAKEGDEITFSVDYSKATFKDAHEVTVCSPLTERDKLIATFVNYKTAFEVTKDQRFEDMKNERVQKVTEEYDAKLAEFAKEKDEAIAKATADQNALAGEALAKEAELKDETAKLNAKLAEAKALYSKENKEAKAKHAKILKDALAAINAQYKEMGEKEKLDYQESMRKNRDPESRRQRRLAYQVFRESFPQMKQNDIERKTNSLEFDKETELNAVKFRYTQVKGDVKDTIKQHKLEFESKYHPLDAVTKEYAKKEKELMAARKEALFRAELLFFFKYDDYYQVIPEDITKKAIQGLGEKVFTKNFRIEVPHDVAVEEEGAIPFKVVALVNYGDVKLYKCTGELFGEKMTVYINKTRDIELGSVIHLRPELSKTQIYEDERNIRLY